jgi:ankyrin repeat protein
MYCKYELPEMIEAVFEAVKTGEIENLRFYLMDGADPDMRNTQGSTLLHIAAIEGQKECAQLLLDFGADPSLTDARGHTAGDIVRAKENAAAEEIARDERQKRERLKNDMAALRANRPLKKLGPSR